jgi:hypothetical protein
MAEDCEDCEDTARVCRRRGGQKQSEERGASRELPDEARVIEAAFPARFSTLPFRKCVPEAEGFVSRARDDRLAVRTHREVEHTARVARERHDHVQRRVLPNAYLVLGGR